MIFISGGSCPAALHASTYDNVSMRSVPIDRKMGWKYIESALMMINHDKQETQGFQMLLLEDLLAKVLSKRSSSMKNERDITVSLKVWRVNCKITAVFVLRNHAFLMIDIRRHLRPGSKLCPIGGTTSTHESMPSFSK